VKLGSQQAKLLKAVREFDSYLRQRRPHPQQ
jgi:hypothetical protein